MSSPDLLLSQRLSQLGIALPAIAQAYGAYVPAKRVGNLLFVAGQLPMKDGQLTAIGQVPSRCAVETARAAARQCVVNGLAAAAGVAGGIDRLIGVVRVGVFVSSEVDFTQQPLVANGASELLLELFGHPGRHVRAAVGVNTLPLDASVEVELLFELGSADA